ncbi:MAG: ligand-binding sensor domain-containing protein [Saprospiraceae bacterium]|jgi:ligand-binding sensor domain-containing protein
MKKYRPFCSLLLLFVFITSCKGQNKTDLAKDSISQSEKKSSDFDSYFKESQAITTSYGPTNITRNIIQDRNGNFWFATWEGIIRYDGKSFTNFTNKEGLRRFRVFTILEDKTGVIWFGTIGAGVYRYDPSAEPVPSNIEGLRTGGKSFTNITTKEGLINNKLGCIYEDKKGNTWFGTKDGISILDSEAIGTGEISFRNFTTEDGLTNNNINSIIEDKNGNIWIGTRGDACIYDGKTFTNFKNKDGSSFENVRCIIEDKKGNIWLGGNDGLWCYDGSTFTNFTTDFVGYIYEDRKGNIWTSSEAPNNSHKWVLSRYDVTPPPVEQLNVTQILTKEDMFFGILEDKEGGIWLGTLNGVCRYDGRLPDGVEQGKSFNYFKEKEVQD